jgi:hypothetical protein
VVPAIKLVIELVNGVERFPSFVLLFAVVGPVLVFQHTPFAVMGASPSLEITPPLVANVVEMLVNAFVVRIGVVGTYAGFA